VKLLFGVGSTLEIAKHLINCLISLIDAVAHECRRLVVVFQNHFHIAKPVMNDEDYF